MVIDQRLLDQILAENPAVNPTDFSTGLTDVSVRPSIDDLMSRSYSAPTRSFARPIIPRPVPQRVDPETMGQPRTPTEEPSVGIPQSIRDRAKAAKFFAQLSNFTGGLGQSGRGFRPDPTAPYRAEADIRNQFLKERQIRNAERDKKALMALQQGTLDLQRRKLEESLRPKPVDPLKRQKAEADIRKAEAEAQIKEREIEQFGTEEERKKDLIQMINTAMEKTVASESMSLKTLEDMASDIGLDPLKLRRAKAAGGGSVSGKNLAYSTEKAPQLAEAIIKAAKSKSRFLADPADQEAYDITVSSTDLSAKQKREVIEQQGWAKEIDRTQDRLYKYADETLKKISAPENGVATMLKAITDLKQTLAKHPEIPGWNAVSSAANAFGPLGQWAVDLKQFKDPAAKDVMQAVRGYNEAYRRLYSGAAINKDEKADFASQLGAGAFSTPDSLRIGVTRAEKILRNGIWNSFSTIDERVWDEYIPRAKTFLPREKTVTRSEAQSVADKYRSAR